MAQVDNQMSDTLNHWFRTVIIHADCDIQQAFQSIRKFMRKRGFSEEDKLYTLKVSKFNFLVRTTQGELQPIPVSTITIIANHEKVAQCSDILNLKMIFGTKAPLPVLEPNFKYGISILKTNCPSVNIYKKFLIQIKWYKPDFHLWLPKINDENQTLCVRIHLNVDKMLSDNKNIPPLLGTWGTRIYL